MSVAAPYRHFDSKEALLGALAERGFDELRTGLETAAAASPDAPQLRLVALGVAYVNHAIANPELFRLMFTAGARGATAEAAPAALAALTVCIQEAQHCGLLPASADPRELTRIAWSTIHGLATLQIDGMLDLARLNGPPEALAAKTTTTLLDGLRRASM